MRVIEERNIEVLDDRMAEILKEKTPGQRLAIACGLWNSARKMLLCHLRASHPGWDEDRIQRETASRMSHGIV